MDDRQSKLLVALSAVLAILVLGIVYMEPPGPDLEDGRRWTRADGDWTADSVSGISLTLGGRTIRMSRETGGWRWVEPVEVAADGARVDALVRSVLDMEVGAALDLDPTAVGLGPEAPRVELEGTDGTTRSIRFGDDAPVGSSSYVQVDGGAVQPTRTRVRTALPATVDDLRVRTLASFPRADVTGLHVGALADLPPHRFEKDDQGWWIADLTPRVRAAETRLYSAIDALRFSEAEAFHDTSPPLGSDAWRVSVTHGAKGETSEVRLARSPEGGWLASGPAQPGRVTLAGQDLPDQLTVADADWRETRLAILRPTTLDGLTFTQGAERLTASRTAEGWTDPRAEVLLMAIETGSVDRGDGTPSPSGDATATLEVRHGEQVSQVVFFQTLDGGAVVATETGTTATMAVAPGTIAALGGVWTAPSTPTPGGALPADAPPAGHPPSP